MRKYLIIAALAATSPSVVAQAQEASMLAPFVKDVIALRQAKASKAALNQTVLRWSGAGRPKITLMDEIGRSPDEYRGDGAGRFKMNQVVTFVYDRQNKGLTTKGEFFNSTELGVFFSAIEKSVAKGKVVTYTLTGHQGPQELAFVPFSQKAKYSVKVNAVAAKPDSNGVAWVTLPHVSPSDSITFTITLAADNAAAHESFTILNYNPQQ